MLEHGTTIYTTGATLCPAKITIDGNVKWMWVVVEFADDSFREGDIYNPPECADTEAELLVNTTD